MMLVNFLSGNRAFEEEVEGLGSFLATVLDLDRLECSEENESSGMLGISECCTSPLTYSWEVALPAS